MSVDRGIFAAAILVCGGVLLASPHQLWIGLAVSVAGFSALWLISLPLANASIVDAFWGPGFVLLAWWYVAAVIDSATPRGLLAAALVTIWGFRLGLYIAIRNAGKGEDFRYRSWREEAGVKFWWVSYFKVFLLQAVVLWIVATPLYLAHLAEAPHELTVLDWLGVLLWLVGFTFEAVADWQLIRFKRDPANRGRVLASGLWGLSRHPNYFGEAVLWWGIGLLGAAGGGPLALISPVIVTFLLLRISGVALLDRALVERKPQYAAYLRSTPAFLPLGRRRSTRYD